MVLGLGLSIAVLGVLSTGPRALATARRAAALFPELDQQPAGRPAAVGTAPR
jgi:hypothetical protein